MEESRITPEMIALVPDLKNWGDSPIDIEDWIGATGNYELAIGYSRVFWPRIAQFGDYYLLEKQGDEESIATWERQFNGDKSAVEAMLNHTHMIDLHVNKIDYTEAQLIELGRTLKEIYQAKLAGKFPEVKFEVAFDDTPGLNPEDYQVTFWRVRDVEES
jgi:hypothetical protein